MINAAQIRAARGLLGISQSALSELAAISAGTVKRLESAQEVRGSAASVLKIQTALERAGVEFIPGDEIKGPGVRLKHAGKAKPKRVDRRGASR
jgi:transcriptional regulator with XRE-family HTH domain